MSFFFFYILLLFDSSKFSLMVNVGLAEVAEEIRKFGGKCWTYYCDIADKEAVYQTAKAVQVEVGNVSKILIKLQKFHITNYYRIYQKCGNPEIIFVTISKRQ